MSIWGRAEPLKSNAIFSSQKQRDEAAENAAITETVKPETPATAPVVSETPPVVNAPQTAESGKPKLSLAERRQKHIADLKLQIEKAANVLKAKQDALTKAVEVDSGEARKKRNAQIYAVGGAIVKYYRELKDEKHRSEIKEICLANSTASNRERTQNLFDAIDEEVTSPASVKSV